MQHISENCDYTTGDRFSGLGVPRYIISGCFSHPGW